MSAMRSDLFPIGYLMQTLRLPMIMSQQSWGHSAHAVRTTSTIVSSPVTMYHPTTKKHPHPITILKVMTFSDQTLADSTLKATWFSNYISTMLPWDALGALVASTMYPLIRRVCLPRSPWFLAGWQ